MENIQKYLRQCRQLAQNAAKKGNSAVGAVVVQNAVVIGAAEEAGRSKNDVTCHAEIEAIRQAVQNLNTNDLSDCFLISTHEPCVMCAYVIRYHRLSAVYYEQKVETVGSINSKHPILIDAEFWNTKPVPVVYQVASAKGDK